MYSYNFKLTSDEKNILKKKSFTLKVEEKLDDTYELFSEAVSYIEDNYYNIFNLDYDDNYFDFELHHKKEKVNCSVEYEFCDRCGGDFNVY